MTSTLAWSGGHDAYRPGICVVEGRIRARARNLVDASGARLQRATTRAGGDDGAALAAVFIDMVRSEVAPEGWPLPEMIRLLSGEAGRDRQVARLLEALQRLESEIDRLNEEGDVREASYLPG